MTSGAQEDARAEFALYAEGRHPLLERMEPGLRGAILNYLRTFRAAIGPDFDFRNGSIGNFILTGAHLRTTATSTPLSSSSGNSATLRAMPVHGQHRVTDLDEAEGEIGVREIALSAKDGAAVAANEAVIESLESADVVVFGPGSFYTSVCRISSSAISCRRSREKVHARRVFISNILQCRETRGMDVTRMLEMAAGVWRRKGGVDVRPFTHVLANRQVLPFEKTVGPFAYLANGPLEEFGARLGAQVVIGEFEDPWQRGHHDGSAVAVALSSLLPS
ncbi:hypothetical protein DdX_22349 [Ditylenchus destructor]|uniref:YvcK family protein n=1 Tax=Ditylenchus destructor TaxID=166010 RepID=A0AAD4MDP7_9BILA|nr:hypothetical protein DdX_22349 [Ditylenchus destructor]